MSRSSAVVIRDILPSEIAPLADITLAAYEQLGFELGSYRPSLLDVAGRAAEATVLVAADGDHLLGGVTYVRDRDNAYAEFTDADAAGIRMLAVAPEAQHRGVGASLIRACLARAATDGRRRVVLHTTAHMTAAQRLYAQLGFRRTPERDWRPQPHVLLLGYEMAVGNGDTERTVDR